MSKVPTKKAKATGTPRSRSASKTAAATRRLRGILKRKPGGKPFAEEMAQHKRAEKELEEAKPVRNIDSR